MWFIKIEFVSLYFKLWTLSNFYIKKMDLGVLAASNVQQVALANRPLRGTGWRHVRIVFAEVSFVALLARVNTSRMSLGATF